MRLNILNADTTDIAESVVDGFHQFGHILDLHCACSFKNSFSKLKCPLTRNEIFCPLQNQT